MSKKKHKGKYRVESDHASNAAYYITIVTNNRNQYFGNIKTSHGNDIIMQQIR